MAYRAIYRKWRPLVFEDVVGQKHITDTLKNEIVTGKTAHAYLFCGTRGTGKTTTAKILSRSVNCLNPLPDGNPCNECSACKGILNNAVMDVVEIDAASNNGVDNIRELRDDVLYTPAEVRKKVYIIDEVHMLSGGAFNALLKTLEEPPSHVLFILATTEPHKIPATIQSRCQRFDFRRISAHNIAGRVGEITSKDGIKINNDAIRLIAELGDGSMRDALSILDLCSGIQGEITAEDIQNVTGAVSKAFLYDITGALICADISTAFSVLNAALECGREILSVADEMLGFFRELLVCKYSKDAQNILDKTKEAIDKNNELVSDISGENLIYAINSFSSAIYAMKTSVNPRAVLEAALVKLCFPEYDPSSEAFASRIKKLESGTVLTNQKSDNIVKSMEQKQKTTTPKTNISPEPPPFDTATPSQQKTLEKKDKPVSSTNLSELKRKLFTNYPYLRVLGENVEFIKQNETTLVVCETKQDMERSNNITFIKEIESFIGGKIRLTYKGETDLKPKEDPLDDIINKAKECGQLNLF